MTVYSFMSVCGCRKKEKCIKTVSSKLAGGIMGKFLFKLFYLFQIQMHYFYLQEKHGLKNSLIGTIWYHYFFFLLSMWLIFLCVCISSCVMPLYNFFSLCSSGLFFLLIHIYTLLKLYYTYNLMYISLIMS